MLFRSSFTLETLFILLLLSTSVAYGQHGVLQQSICFESAKSTLTTESQVILGDLLDSLPHYQAYEITVKGYTDNVGDSTFNKTLSAQRVSTTVAYLMAHGIPETVLITGALGEENPVADNFTPEGKQKNRRVDITVSFDRKVPIDTLQPQPSIRELYRQIATPPQQFCVNPSADTVLRCKNGTLVYIKANSFKIPYLCRTQCLNIRVKEDFLKSEMILDNLSTTSDGRLIETQGMIYVDALDCKDKKVEVLRGKDLVIFVPADTIVPDANIFEGRRTPHDSIINWTVSNAAVFQQFSLSELNICGNWMCGGVRRSCKRCPFFFCRLRRAGLAAQGLINQSTHENNILFRECQRQLARERRKLHKQQPNRALPQSTVVVERPPLAPDLVPACEQLEALYEKYGVHDFSALIAAVNQPLLDSFGITTIAELQDTLMKISVENFEMAYTNKKISYADLKYYVFNTSRLGWSNIDNFVEIPKDSLTNFKVNLEIADNVDCKLVFIDRQFVIPADRSKGKYVFEGVPKGERVWIVALKMENGQPFLFMEKTRINSQPHDVRFVTMTLEELKLALARLDRQGER